MCKLTVRLFLLIFFVLSAGVALAQTGNTLICYRYTDVNNGQVKTEFGYISPDGTFTATSTYYNPTSICTVDTLRAITGRTVIDQPLWDANAAYYSTFYTVSSQIYQVQGNPCYLIDAIPAPPAASGSAVNISTRLNVGTGDNVLIAGFIVSGTGQKKVMVRAIGPSLIASKLSGVLMDPTLKVFDSAGHEVATNDDWQTTVISGVVTRSQTADITASKIAPTDPKESALIATLDPGAYTAIVEGAGGAAGIAVVDIYDLSSSTPAKMANISTRGYVRPGDNAMIGGFIIAGQPATVVVRGIGPSLAKSGLQNTLTDPTLELHDGNGGLIGSNDDWMYTMPGGAVSGNQSLFLQEKKLAPTDFNESAMAVTLSPGSYTAIVRGSGSTSGLGLVEVYSLQ